MMADKAGSDGKKITPGISAGSYSATPGHPKTGGAPKRPHGPRLVNIAQMFAFVKPGGYKFLLAESRPAVSRKAARFSLDRAV